MYFSFRFLLQSFNHSGDRFFIFILSGSTINCAEINKGKIVLHSAKISGEDFVLVLVRKSYHPSLIKIASEISGPEAQNLHGTVLCLRLVFSYRAPAAVAYD